MEEMNEFQYIHYYHLQVFCGSVGASMGGEKRQESPYTDEQNGMIKRLGQVRGERKGGE